MTVRTSDPGADLRRGGAVRSGFRSRNRIRSGNLEPALPFIEDDGQRHDVWFLDAVTAYNEIGAGE